MNFPEKLHAHKPASALKLLEISQLQGEEYLQSCAEFVRSELGVFAVSIGELEGPSVDRVGVIAMARRDQSSAPDSYALAGSPCLDVVLSSGMQCVLADAAVEYPQDQEFQTNTIVSYVGLPLRDGFDRIFGIFCVYDDAPCSDPEGVLETLQWFAPRIGNEAGAIRTRRNLLKSMQWMATSAAEDIFRGASEYLCDVLQVTTAFVVEWNEDSPGSGFAHSFVHAGSAIDGVEGEIVEFIGMPFEMLLESDVVCVVDGLEAQYPNCGLVVERHLQSIIAFVVRDAQGKAIGHLGIAHTRSLQESLVRSPAFMLYLARVAVELDRQRAERERREMERALSVKHKLESIGLMAGHIAHDFNNLLMAILGNANLAADMLEKDSPIRRFIENIEAASTSAGDVVSQLLDYAGRKPTRAVALDVSEAVSSASRLVELSHYPMATVDYDLKPGLPAVNADPAQLQQIVVNLVLNAAEALDNRPGTIRIKTDLVQLTRRRAQRLIQGQDLQPGSYVSIRVSDDGVGIDEATALKMFDPFFTSKPPGRGLGLSAVRGFVQSDKGGVSVTTSLGSGTSVEVLLLPGVQQAASAEPEGVLLQASETTVLVVDDEIAVGQVAAAMLSRMDFRVQTCVDCQSAVQAVTERHFDCALVDVRMPGIDGWATVKQLREIQPALPVVMMTGYANDGRPAELISRFDAVVLHKPFAHQELLQALQHAISSPSG